jgi:4-hydroxy-tetrahydrodipicolinate reductase
MTKVIIVGSKGRMGQNLIKLAQPVAGYSVVAGIDAGDDLAPHVPQTDAIIEFSHHTVTGSVARLAVANHKALVIGTTGHTDDEKAEIAGFAKSIPVVFAPNFSIGVNLLFYLTRKAAQILGPDYDEEVIEMHHRLKLDAPSGTARRLGEILAEVQGGSYDELVRNGRSGEVGKRTKTEIGMHALRGGDVVGDHTVYFATVGERVELTHRASSRETFANGALRAAAWAVKQPAGLYSMQDVLGLHD